MEIGYGGAVSGCGCGRLPICLTYFASILLMTVVSPESAIPITREAAETQAAMDRVIAAVSTVFLGRRVAIETALACVLADGHLLIEDTPGSGKTSLSAALAQALGLGFQRVQCTNDLLPADITGLSIFNRETSEFVLREGPVFTQLLLADELNRAPSKTQSALLQAMEERKVTIDKATLDLPKPFLVIATQNPAEQIGTFDLPESQLDRFSLSMQIGRPDYQTQLDILTGRQTGMPADVPAVIDTDALLDLQAMVRQLPADAVVMGYILRLSDMLESLTPIALSVRFRAQLLRLAQAHAVLHGRHFVAPDDVQAMFAPAVRHRMTRVEPGARDELTHSAIAKTDLP